MMSALNAKALRARSATPDDEHDQFATRDTVFDQVPDDPAETREPSGQYAVESRQAPADDDPAAQYGPVDQQHKVGRHNAVNQYETISRHDTAGRHGPVSQRDTVDRRDAVGQYDQVGQRDTASQHDTAGQPETVGQYDAVGQYGPVGQHDAVGRRDAASQYDSADRLDISALGQSIPTPPDPDEMPEPPDGPDIPKPSRHPDIPTSPDPERIPPIPGTPAEPGPPPHDGESTRSRLMAAFDALTGPMPSRTTFEDERPRSAEAAAEQPATDRPVIRDQFESGSGLPSRKPLKSWSELRSSSTVDSPADNLFGAPGERPRTAFKSSLGAAFADFEPGELPTTPGNRASESPTPPNHWADSAVSGGRSADAVAPSAAQPEPSATAAVSPEPPVLPKPPASHEPAAAPEPPAPEPTAVAPGSAATSFEPPVSFGPRPALRGQPAALPEPLPGAADAPSTTPLAAWSGLLAGPTSTPPSAPFTTPPAGPSAARAKPSGASVAGTPQTVHADHTTEPPPAKPPTYDEPFGPEPRPEGLPRRGERSATTIASLLTEALAAYQSTADDEDEPLPAPERYDFLGDQNTIAGRHRSTE